MPLDVAFSSLASPPVLAFFLGVLAVLIRSDLKIPDGLTGSISIYLLLAIGLDGGVGLRDESIATVAFPILLALGLGITIPVAAYWVLRWLTPLDPVNRGTIAAHYGSTSLVTFTAMIVFLNSLQIAHPAYSATLLTVLEIPGIIVGIMLAGRHTRHVSFRKSFHEVITGSSIVLLFGGMVIGFIVGPEGFGRVQPFFDGLFSGILTLFLLALGLKAAERMGQLRHAGIGFFVFALIFPLVVGAIGVFSAAAIGMDIGGAAILGILCASASYIAAPAAVKFALPQVHPAYALGASIGLTLPLNLVVGIPFLVWLATSLRTGA